MPNALDSPTGDPRRLLEAAPFAFLPPDLATKVIVASRAVQLGSGEVLVRAGRFPMEVFIPVNGELKRIADGTAAQGQGELVNAYEPLGLDCLVLNKPFAQAVIAQTEATVRVVPWKDLQPALSAVPGLLAYLRARADSAAIRELDLTLGEMGCSPAFRTALIGDLRPASAEAGAWLARRGETPAAAFYAASGAVQAFGEEPSGVLKALWIAPNLTWQLFAPCLEGKPLGYDLKAVAKVELFRIGRESLETLKARFAGDFEAFAKVALRMELEKEEEDDSKEVDDLKELFPSPPRPVRGLRLSYPFVQQKDAMDCGPACMAMISKYYGNDLPVQFWRDRMSTNQEGTSLFDLAYAAEKVGFVAHGLQIGDLAGFEPDLLPVVALRQYHYLVIYRVEKSGLLLGDPALGVRKMSWEDFKKGFNGEILALKPTDQFYRQSTPHQGYSHYAAMFRGQGRELGLVALTSLMLSGFEMVPAFLSQFVLDQVLSKKDSQLLSLVIIAAFLTAGLGSLVSWLRSYYLAFIAARFDFSAFSAFTRKLFSLPYEFFATRHVGDFTRRLAELERLREFASQQLIETALQFVNLLVYGTVLFVYSPTVALAVFAGSPVLVLLSLAFSRRMALILNESFSHRAEQEGVIGDQIKGIATIKTLGAEVASRWRFEEAVVRTLRSRYHSQLTATTLSNLSRAMHQALKFAILGLSASLALRGEMTPGQVVSVSVLSTGIIEPFAALAALWSQIQDMRIGLDRLNDVFLAESESRPETRALIKQRLRGEIEFCDVWFRYGGGSSDWVLKDLSFHIPAGHSVAIVGQSGSGKSTLALLTARLYEPTKGTILIDGRDYREYDRQWLRGQVGLLLQEHNLFHGTILDNIAYGDPKPDLARVDAAAERADAKKFIQEKSAGYDFVITHGGMGLSVGQKQRICIARILYTNPAILFLDEATASLDNISERAVMASLREASRKQTMLMIAHRYSTVRMSDYVVVMEAGKVSEFGTHQELAAAGGRYAELFGDQIQS